MKKFFLTATFASVVAISSAQAEVNFATDILPILRDNCIKCHGEEKQKGKLRLDSQAAAHDSSIVAGSLDDSEFYRRIILPADDDDVMPPKDGPLKKEEIALLKQWIQEGAKYTGVDVITADAGKAAEKTQDVADAAADSSFDFNADIQPILNTLSPDQKSKLMAWISAGAVVPQQKAAEPQLVEAESSDTEKAALAKLQADGVLAMKVAQNVNWVQANFRLAGDKIKNDHLAPLKDIPNLTDLDLSKTGISDEGLAHISGLKNLTRLNLNNTAVTDAGLAHLAGLTNLTYLNLYGTSVTDKGVENLSDIKTLQKLYLWQTKVSDSGAATLKSNLPWLYINRGIELAALAPEPAKEEPKKEEPKKEVAEKKPEPAQEEAKKEEPAASGPSIADVFLFLTKAEEAKEAAPVVAATAKVAEVKKAAQAQVAEVKKAATEKAVEVKKAVEAKKPAAAEASGPSISDVLLFISKSEAAAPAPAEKVQEDAPKATGPSISSVLLFLSSVAEPVADEPVESAEVLVEFEELVVSITDIAL